MHEFKDLTEEIIAFRDARDWSQYHTPRHLAAGLSVEAAELQETMLWLSDREVEALLDTPDQKQEVQREVADVLIFALLLCERCGINPGEAIRAKLAENASKYPVELARGRATKYTKLKHPKASDSNR